MRIARRPLLATTLLLTAVLTWPADRVLARQECLSCREVSASPLLPVASLVMPGTGQLLADRNRGIGYLVAEALFLAWHLESADRAQRRRARYRNLAFSVARRAFMPSIRDTTFEYFEQMGKYVASGPFDTDPGPALVPPDDESTFNGSLWGLARRTFFPDPEDPPAPDSESYLAALAFYRSRAVGPNFRWSWEGNLNAMEGFTDAISESDEAFRRSAVALAVVFANHLVSAIDAHISNQLSGRSRTVSVHMRVGIESPRAENFRVGGGVRISF